MARTVSAAHPGYRARALASSRLATDLAAFTVQLKGNTLDFVSFLKAFEELSKQADRA